MTPEMTALLGQLGIAAVFVVAWFRSENMRDKERERHQLREDTLVKNIIETQTVHRREILQLIRDITFKTASRDLSDLSAD